MIFFYFFILLSIYQLLKINIGSLLSLFLISTLINQFNIPYFSTSLKIEYILFIFLSIRIFIHEWRNTNTFKIVIDSKLILIFYLIVAGFLVKIIYPDMLVWPVCKNALGTVVDTFDKHLILLGSSSSFITQILFVVYPIFFYILISKVKEELILLSLKHYIYALTIISIINISIYILIALFPNLINFFDGLFKILFYDGFEYRFGYNEDILKTTRVSLLIGEPSFMAIYVIPIIVFLYLTNYNTNKKYFIIFIFLFLNLLFSRTTSGIITILLVFLSILFLKPNLKLNISKFLFLSLFIFIIVISSNFFSDYIQYLVTKFNNPSSSIWARIWSINHSLYMFLKYLCL